MLWIFAQSKKSNTLYIVISPYTCTKSYITISFLQVKRPLFGTQQWRRCNRVYLLQKTRGFGGKHATFVDVNLTSIPLFSLSTIMTSIRMATEIHQQSYMMIDTSISYLCIYC